MYYLAPTPYDQQALFENGIGFVAIPAGKTRRYASIKNFTDIFVTLAGIIRSLITLFRIYPDVVMSKGGFASVPVVIAARILHIPVVIHESDSKPGRANLLAAKFAKKIAISFESAASFFPKKVQSKIARTGNPVRKALMRVESEGARQYLSLEEGIPTVFILGGSQGAQRINDVVLSALPELVSFANVIHQTGAANLKDVEALAKVMLEKSSNASRYHPLDFLSEISMQRAAGAADVIISRAGTGTIFEIGLWKKPAIIIPIPESISHDQRSNAYSYAHTGAAVVIEEGNLTPHLLVSEVKRITGDKELAAKMATAAEGFTDPDAARILANALLTIGIEHEV